MHIEEGEPVFVNNPYVRSTLTNHVWGFTFFDNRSISFEKRDFTGKLKVGTKEYEYYSVNDLGNCSFKITGINLQWLVIFAYDKQSFGSYWVGQPRMRLFHISESI